MGIRLYDHSRNLRLGAIASVSKVVIVWAAAKVDPPASATAAPDIPVNIILASVHFLGYWLGAVSVTRVPCAPKTLLVISLIVIGLGTVAMGLTDMFSVWLVG